MVTTNLEQVKRSITPHLGVTDAKPTLQHGVMPLWDTGYDEKRLDSILQNISSYTVFAFDFDKTLSMDHTGGYPVNYLNRNGKDVNTLFGNGGLAKLFKMIKDIKGNGIEVYIVSRGINNQLVETFKQSFINGNENLLDLIGGPDHIYGAIEDNNTTTQNALYVMSPFPSSDDNKTKKQNYNNNVLAWASYKLEYLKDILGKKKTNRILFFDDTHENIEILYSDDGNIMIDGIQQNKKQGLNATEAIVTELLKLRGGATATQQTRRPPPPPPGSIKHRRAGNNINYPSTAGTLRSGLPPRRPAPPPPSPKNQRTTFSPVTLHRLANTTHDVTVEPLMESLPANRARKRSSGNGSTNANLPLPPNVQGNSSEGPVESSTHMSDPHTNNPSGTHAKALRKRLPSMGTVKRKVQNLLTKFGPTNATKTRVREGFRKAGEFGKAVAQGALQKGHKLFKTPKPIRNEEELRRYNAGKKAPVVWSPKNIKRNTPKNIKRNNASEPKQEKEKGFFGRLLSGTRKRVPSMGNVKRLFGRKQSMKKTEEKEPLLPRTSSSKKTPRSLLGRLGKFTRRMLGRKQSTQNAINTKLEELIPTEDEASEIARTVPTPASSAVNPVAVLFGKYKVNAYSIPRNNTSPNVIEFTDISGNKINPTEMTLPEIPGMPADTKSEEETQFNGLLLNAINPIRDNARKNNSQTSFQIDNGKYTTMIEDLKHIDTLVTELQTHYDKTIPSYTKVIKNAKKQDIRLLGIYDVYTINGQQKPEYIFVDKAGNKVPLERLRLPVNLDDTNLKGVKKIMEIKLYVFKQNFGKSGNNVPYHSFYEKSGTKIGNNKETNELLEKQHVFCKDDKDVACHNKLIESLNADLDRLTQHLKGKLFEKYNLYAKPSESGRVEYTFKDMEGNVVALDDLKLPDYIAEDMRELAQNKLDKFKTDFVSASQCNQDNIDCHKELVNTLNNDHSIKRPKPEVIPTPLPERANPPPAPAVFGRRSSVSQPTRQASMDAKNQIPIRLPSNTPGPKRSGSSSKQRTKSTEHNNQPALLLPGRQTSQSSNKQPVPPPRTKKQRHFNMQSTKFNNVVQGFSDKFKEKLLASENELINKNAEAIATCINKPDTCTIDKKVIETEKPVKELIRTILNDTLNSLTVNGQPVGAKKRADVAQRITQLFGN